MAYASHEVGARVTCAETGRAFIVSRDGCSFNYASNTKGETLSDEGVNLREVRELLDRSRPFGCYLSSDGKRATGWKGNTLGAVVHASPVTLTRRSVWHGSHMLAVRVRDVHGAMWHGRGSPGVLINLRPMKGAAK
jgi:hypothetical protein